MSPGTATAKSHGPRMRLIASAIELVRERGVEGAGLSELLEHSHTARRSIYQNFPGGKTELIVASTTAAGAWVERNLEALGTSRRRKDPARFIEDLVETIARNLAEEDYRLGCPIAAAAVAAPEAMAVRQAAADVFDSWASQLARSLTDKGRDLAEARSLASFAVSAIEGAMLRARAARSPRPLHEAAEYLGRLC